MTAVYRGFSLRDTPRLDERVALVTGGQAGIGQEICKQLLLHGIRRLYILARTESRFNDALKEWNENLNIKLAFSMTQEKDQNQAQQPEQQEGSIVEFVQCDLSDILSVKRAVDIVQSGTDRMDIVICNAAPTLTPAYFLSRQEIEIMFAANCVGHHILVTSLLPLLKSAIVKYEEPDARVVVTTSSCHQFCREIDFDLLTSPKATKSVHYDGIWRYCRSKLGNILFTRELSRRLVVESLSGDKASSQIYVNCYVPGNIPTEKMDIFRKYVGAPLGWAMKKYFYFFGHTEEDGAATGMFLAASPHVRDEDIRGEYFVPIARKDTTSTLGKDKELGIKLWNWTEDKVSETLWTVK